MFWYKIDVDNNIIAVSQLEPMVWSEELQEMVSDAPNWQTAPIADYSPLWDEAKRCPNALDGQPRYVLQDGQITPTAAVANIEVHADYDLQDDGTLRFNASKHAERVRLVQQADDADIQDMLRQYREKRVSNALVGKKP